MKIFTVDLEEWFHLLIDNEEIQYQNWDRLESRFESQLDYLLYALSEESVIAIFFVVGWLAEKYPKSILKIHNSGHLIGSHSYYHRSNHKLTQEQFEADLSMSCNLLGDLTGAAINCYRAPSFSISNKNLWVFETLVNSGIKYDFSVFNALRLGGGISTKLNLSAPFKINVGKQSIIEFPISVYSAFDFFSWPMSGGGYFRLTPLSMILHYAKKTEYFMFYIHPRDIDEFQPRLKDCDVFTRFRLYYGLHSAKDKLRRLLGDIKFTNASDIVNLENKDLLNYSLEDLA